jgi:hypothetical protein
MAAVAVGGGDAVDSSDHLLHYGNSTVLKSNPPHYSSATSMLKHHYSMVGFFLHRTDLLYTSWTEEHTLLILIPPNG